VNLLGGKIDTVNKSIEASSGSSKEVDLEVNVEKTKYTLVSNYRNAD
jgi:hypothetical protein